MTDTFGKELDLRRPDFGGIINSASPVMIPEILEKQTVTFGDFLALLSPAAEGYLEAMAMKSKALTDKHFGKNINMYIPMYLSNECNSSCAYCGFNRMSKIARKTLTLSEIAAEAKRINAGSMRHLLLLTGDDRSAAPVKYIAAAVKETGKTAAQISLEVYPMDTPDYKKLVKAGATGLTIYHETYDRIIYDKVHRGGAKADFEYRLKASERALEAGFRKIGIGALLGLSDWRVEAACLGLHASYLMKKYWRADLSVSFPRLKKSDSGFKPYTDISDRELAQMIFAFRIYLERAGIAISTRETAQFRGRMTGYGVTAMSAGSMTNPGGYSGGAKESGKQFETEDTRSVEETARAIKESGYYPVFKDWDKTMTGVE